jgi:hypothetical protein
VQLQEEAEFLAGKASQGELALFVGAGVSASAGLPLWYGLLVTLATSAGMPENERQGLQELDPMDQAAIIEGRLGGAVSLQEAIRKVFTGEHYSLAHAFLAALPVAEVVTTNYDQLFELACRAVGRTPSVLPHAIRPDAKRWVLKMHGCVSHPEDIVLTRGDYLGYAERRAALAGIVQALLITRHMLFVGFSLKDDNFHRIADAVRRAVRPFANPESMVAPFGTTLTLVRNPLVEELWKKDLRWVSMAGLDQSPSRAGGTEAILEAGRRLEIFLDYLLAETRDAAHLLDDRYRAVLTEPERALSESLLQFKQAALPKAREAPAWAQIEKLLAGLGLASGPDADAPAGGK